MSNESLPPTSIPVISGFQPTYHARLHWLANLRYYVAVARYRRRWQRFPQYRNRCDYKNTRVFCRLTEKGLCLLRTNYARKPKNPV